MAFTLISSSSQKSCKSCAAAERGHVCFNGAVWIEVTGQVDRIRRGDVTGATICYWVVPVINHIVLDNVVCSTTRKINAVTTFRDTSFMGDDVVQDLNRASGWIDINAPTSRSVTNVVAL